MSGTDDSGAVTIPVGTACGKVILLGEHAVVYGAPAIAAGIERGAWARARRIEEGPSRLSIPAWGVLVHEGDPGDLGRAFAALLTEAGISGREAPVAVEAEAQLPPGGGLGCSAALGVAVARAIEPGAPEAKLAARVAAWEGVFHGNPSGVDAACAANGGCVLFTKGTGVEPIRIGAPLHLCIGNSGTSSSTKEMVESVARLRARKPDVARKTFDGITALVRNARLAIEAGDTFALGRLMDLNQMLLSGLFLSTPEIERLCGLARDAGAFGAKLTGAGGGGCVVALVKGEEAAEPILEAWRSAGFEGFTTSVLRVERADVALGGAP
ncbi:MAG TPA: mevalonate kinase [Polyangiaceae bacterium]